MKVSVKGEQHMSFKLDEIPQQYQDLRKTIISRFNLGSKPWTLIIIDDGDEITVQSQQEYTEMINNLEDRDIANPTLVFIHIQQDHSFGISSIQKQNEDEDKNSQFFQSLKQGGKQIQNQHKPYSQHSSDQQENQSGQVQKSQQDNQQQEGQQQIHQQVNVREGEQGGQDSQPQQNSSSDQSSDQSNQPNGQSADPLLSNSNQEEQSQQQQQAPNVISNKLKTQPVSQQKQEQTNNKNEEQINGINQNEAVNQSSSKQPQHERKELREQTIMVVQSSLIKNEKINQSSCEIRQQKKQYIKEDSYKNIRICCSFCCSQQNNLLNLQAFNGIKTCQSCEEKWQIQSKRRRVALSPRQYFNKKNPLHQKCSFCGEREQAMFKVGTFNIRSCFPCRYKWEIVPIFQQISYSQSNN